MPVPTTVSSLHVSQRLATASLPSIPSEIDEDRELREGFISSPASSTFLPRDRAVSHTSAHTTASSDATIATSASSSPSTGPHSGSRKLSGRAEYFDKVKIPKSNGERLLAPPVPEAEERQGKTQLRPLSLLANGDLNWAPQKRLRIFKTSDAPSAD